jgi:hypothetical protein
MSAYATTEDQLVEQPATGLFAEFGWATESALDETIGATGTLRRETKGEVVLVLQVELYGLPPIEFQAKPNRSAEFLNPANRVR